MALKKKGANNVSSRKRMRGFGQFTPLVDAILEFDRSYTSHSTLFENLSAVLKGVEKVALYTLESNSFSLYFKYSSGGATPTNLIYPHNRINYKKGNLEMWFDFLDLPNYHLSTIKNKQGENGVEKILVPLVKRNGHTKVNGLLVVEGRDLSFKTGKHTSKEDLLMFFAQLSFKLGRDINCIDISNLPKRNGATEEDILSWIGGSEIGIIFFDVNNLKHINDTLGHDKGDEIIKKVGEVIKNNIILSNSLAYRWGGDEFLIVLKRVDEFAAMHVAERIVKGFSECGLSVSGGVATGHVSNVDDLRRLIKEADESAYNSKRLSKQKEGTNYIICGANDTSFIISNAPVQQKAKLKEEINNYAPLADTLTFQS